jgi:hypothetical protein
LTELETGVGGQAAVEEVSTSRASIHTKIPKMGIASNALKLQLMQIKKIDISLTFPLRQRGVY